MENKHTPGPWYPYLFGDLWELHNKKDFASANIIDTSDVAYETAKANAKLAAAAPELLNLVKELIRNQFDYERSDTIFAAEVLIKEIES